MTPIRYRAVLPSAADLVIIGGGIVGVATAFYAARGGLQPLVLERRPRLGTLTTAVATGAFRLQFETLAETQLVRESVELYLHFREVTGQEEYQSGVRQQGYLWLTTNEQAAARQRNLVARQYGWGQTDIEHLDGDEVRYRFPYVGTNVVGARFRAGDGFLDPKGITLGLAAASGADVVTGCEVTGFNIRGDMLRGVQTSLGTVRTDRAIVAAGPFSGVVASLAGVSLPLENVVRQKVVLPDVPAVPAGSPMIIDEDTGVHWRPAGLGAYVLFADPETPPSPPAEDVPQDHRFAFRLLDPASPVSVARVTPFWNDVWQRGAVSWMIQAGQYTMTPDHLAIIGETAVRGLFVNSGYAGHGIMGSPAGSRLLAELLTGTRSPDDNPFSPGRPYTRSEHAVL